MSATGKNKGKQKGDFDAKVKKIEESFDRLRETVSAKLTELIAKHNNMAQDIAKLQAEQQNIATNAATDIRNIATGYQAMRGSVIEAIEHVDSNTRGLGEVIREVFGQLEVFNLSLTKKELLIDLDELSTEELSEIRKEASEAYGEAVARGLKKVAQERQLELEEKAAQQAKPEEAPKPPEPPTVDEQAIEKELRESETRSVSAVSGGAGADIPEGADVFGG